MAYTLPTNDFMFPHMVTDDHRQGKLRVFNRSTGLIVDGTVCAMREGEYVVINKLGRYTIMEGDFSIAHIR